MLFSTGRSIDPDDKDAIACVIRETAEELGTDIQIDPASVALYHTQLRRSSDSDLLRTNYYYAIRQWSGKPVIGEPDKAEDLRWYNLNALPYDQMMSDIATAFKAKLAGENFSIDGFAADDTTGQTWLNSKT